MKILFIITFIGLAATSVFAKSSPTDISIVEKEAIQLMREEEKLAHDVYLFLSEKWEVPIFRNISNSETRHFDAIGNLIEIFEIKDVALKVPGKFNNQHLQHLYDSLTILGSESLISALKVGAFIEEVDISDLQKSINTTSNETITPVYQNLLRASGNHLRAFTGQLAGREYEYLPQVLDKKTYLSILETPHQKGAGGNQNCKMQTNTTPAVQNSGIRNMHRKRVRLQ